MALLPDRRLPPAAPAPRRRAAAVGLGLLVLLIHAALLGGWFRPAPRLGGAAAPARLQLLRIEAVLPQQPPTSVAVAEPGPGPLAPAPAPAAQSAPLPVEPPSPPRPSARPGPTVEPGLPVPQPGPPPRPPGAEFDRPPPGPRPDDDGDTDLATVPGEPPPRYATRLPGAAELVYRVQRGPLGGEARLQWRPEGDRYQLRFEALAQGRPLIEQHSQGGLSDQGLAPERFTDKRRGRGPQSALFDREAGRIRFSGRPLELPAWPGAQDRLGWAVQLAGIYAAAAEPPAEVQLFVVGARGGAGPWVFRLQGHEAVETPQGLVQALYLRREPEVSADQRIEVWLDPARGHWPLRLRFTPVRGGPPFEWWLQAGP